MHALYRSAILRKSGYPPLKFLRKSGYPTPKIFAQISVPPLQILHPLPPELNTEWSLSKNLVFCIVFY